MFSTTPFILCCLVFARRVADGFQIISKSSESEYRASVKTILSQSAGSATGQDPLVVTPLSDLEGALVPAETIGATAQGIPAVAPEFVSSPGAGVPADALAKPEFGQVLQPGGAIPPAAPPGTAAVAKAPAPQVVSMWDFDDQTPCKSWWPILLTVWSSMFAHLAGGYWPHFKTSLNILLQNMGPTLVVLMLAVSSRAETNSPHAPDSYLIPIGCPRGPLLPGPLPLHMNPIPGFKMMRSPMFSPEDEIYSTIMKCCALSYAFSNGVRLASYLYYYPVSPFQLMGEGERAAALIFYCVFGICQICIVLLLFGLLKLSLEETGTYGMGELCSTVGVFLYFGLQALVNYFHNVGMHPQLLDYSRLSLKAFETQAVVSMLCLAVNYGYAATPSLIPSVLNFVMPTSIACLVLLSSMEFLGPLMLLRRLPEVDAETCVDVPAASSLPALQLLYSFRLCIWVVFYVCVLFLCFCVEGNLPVPVCLGFISMLYFVLELSSRLMRHKVTYWNKQGMALRAEQLAHGLSKCCALWVNYLLAWWFFGDASLRMTEWSKVI